MSSSSRSMQSWSRSILEPSPSLGTWVLTILSPAYSNWFQTCLTSHCTGMYVLMVGGGGHKQEVCGLALYTGSRAQVHV